MPPPPSRNDPPPPEPENRETPGREYRPATWGLAETVAGALGAVFFGLVLGGMVGAVGLALKMSLESTVLRYSMIFASQLPWVGVPLAVAMLTRGGARALGLRLPSGRALLESAACGVLTYGLVVVYSFAMDWVSPELAAKLKSEAETQLKLLAAPWPLLAFMAIVVAPVCEELLFRGFVFGGLRTRFDFALASGLSAAAFAILHLMPVSIVPLFLVGAAASVMFERHRSLYAAIVLHAAFNTTSLIVGTLFPDL